MKRILFISILTAFTACSGDVKPPLVASDVMVMEIMPGMKMTAAYMTLTNNSSDDIRITHVTSPQFESVELHETVVEEDVSRMREVPELIVPASGSVTLERGGMHLMLMRQSDDSDAVSLQIWSGDTMLLAIETSYSKR